MKLFTNPQLIFHVRRAVLALFFERFTHLLANKYALPAPSLDNDNYPFRLAEVLECPQPLPPQLVQAILAVESLFATVTPEPEPDPQTDPEAAAARLQHAIQLWLRQNPPPASPSTPVTQPQTGAAHPVSVTSHPALPTPAAPKPDENGPHSEAKGAQRLARNVQGSAVALPAVNPWPDPVDAQELMRQVLDRFSHYLVLPPGAAVALTLWTAHAHAFTAFLLSPRLNLTSLQPGCGKTTTLDLLASLVPRPLRTENLTAPVLFRLVDQFHPVLLLDEVDTYLTQAEELRGLLNAGHKRGACAYRCEGENNAVRSFKAFTPAVLAGIGSLPDTLLDRSISILLVPAKPGMITANFDQRHTEIETLLTSKLARWTQDNFAALQASDPPMPATAFNRLADNWRPLFAIALIAGGDWPRMAHDAFTHLTARAASAHDLTAIALLSEIRNAFAQAGASQLPSKELVRLLAAASPGPGHPFPAINHRLSEAWLARQLRPLGVFSRTIRDHGHRAKGYALADFAAPFARLLREDSPSKP